MLCTTILPKIYQISVSFTKYTQKYLPNIPNMGIALEMDNHIPLLSVNLAVESSFAVNRRRLACLARLTCLCRATSPSRLVSAMHGAARGRRHRSEGHWRGGGDGGAMLGGGDGDRDREIEMRRRLCCDFTCAGRREQRLSELGFSHFLMD